MSTRRAFAACQLVLAGCALVAVMSADSRALDTLLGASPFQAPTVVRTTKFLEQFNTDTADTASTNAIYSPTWLNGFGGTTNVVGGVLNTTGGGNYTINAAAFTGPVHIAADITMLGSAGGCCNDGMSINGMRFIFHPGYGGGAFRIEPGVGNTNMPFTTVNSIMNHWDIFYDGVNQYTVTITNGSNPSDPAFVYNWTSANPLTRFGFTSSGGQTALFDNFEVYAIEAVVATPEPGSLILAGVALLGLAAFGINHRRRVASPLPTHPA